MISTRTKEEQKLHTQSLLRSGIIDLWLIIKNISLENFRSFKDQTNFDNLKQVNVLVGPNMSGKSNVIMALRFMNFLARNDSTKLFENNIFDNNLEGELSIEVELPPVNLKLSLYMHYSLLIEGPIFMRR